MSNPTLERAARALYEFGMMADCPTWDQFDQKYKEDFFDMTRAVLMAVLPTLERYEIAEDSNQFFGYREFSHKEGEYVHYDDLQAILNDGEGE